MLVLLALLLPLFISSVFANGISTNDPFRTFSQRASRHPKFPICCLKPLSPPDPVEDNVLLSFEEWKAKQQHQSKEQITGHPQNTNTNNSGQEIVSVSNVSQTKNRDHPPKPQNSTSQASPQPSVLEYEIAFKSHQPHFRVPLTDRFNYASIDCSARVHTAHRSAKSPSAVLDSKRDRYMLSPCKRANGERHFIAVELCDDVRIDTVQLANFEFFSGVFKDFSVRVAKTYTPDEEGWVDAGTYRAKNVRGVQSFHPPTSLRDFYRFIRIEFQSYYGNEYYCPVSLLRVYGLTHLEEYKWEQWEEESRAKLESQSSISGKEEPHSATAVESPKEATASPSSTPSAVPLQPSTTWGTQWSDGSTLSLTHLTPQVEISTQRKPATRTGQSEALQSALPDVIDNALDSLQSIAEVLDASPPTSSSTDYPDSFDTHIYSHSMAHSSEMPSIIASLQQPAPSSPAPPPPPASQLSNNHSPHAASSSVVISTSSSHASQIATPSASGESIYRTIMNRLAALEINHTLYARYVEQQNTAIRDVLKRLSEDVGRLEGIGRAHAQAHQRTIQEWERQRRQLQMDYSELLAVVEYLSDEIVLEKRLGVAQLCLLLLVLVFIALTRGSRGEPIIRHLSLSTDWTKRFRNVSSTDNDAVDSNVPLAPSQFANASGLNKFKFPQQKRPLSPANLNIVTSTTASHAHRQLDVRTRKGQDREQSRTPSLRKSIKRNFPYPLHLSPTTHLLRSATPLKSAARRIPLRRSNSHNTELREAGALGSANTARKSAKSAHLHEFIPPSSSRRDEVQHSSTEDVFGSLFPHRRLPIVGLGPTNHERDMACTNKVDDQSDVLHLTGANSEGDQSAWEDTDSVGEMEILDT